MEVCIIYNFNVNPRCLISTDFRNHIISLYTFLFILHKKACILVLCTMINKVTNNDKLLIMGENCVISGSMHFVFQSERYTK